MSFKSFIYNRLPFLLLLVLHVVIVLMFSSNDLIGDENRYLRYATNLTQGYYTNEINPELGNGPGYPLVLAPFVALGAKPVVLKLLNVLFGLTGIIFLYKTLQLFTRKKNAIFFACLIGLYPPLVRFMLLISPEAMAFMVMSVLIHLVFRLYKEEKIMWRHVVLTSFCLGLLVLIKIIFLHVIFISTIISISLFLVKRSKRPLKLVFVIFGSFLVCAPYMIYAYSLTGKLFYLGTGGGEILYHRSTPYDNEWGNWFSREDALYGASPDYKPDNIYRDLSSLSKNHRDAYSKLEPLTLIERDSAFKAMAIENMAAHPGKYVKNTISNIGRLIFHYPFSYREQNLDAYGYMLPNMFITVLLVLSLYPAFLARRRIPFEVKAMMVFTLIYACGIVLSEGRGRNFIIMVPALVLFIVYVGTNIIKITLINNRKPKRD